MNALVPILLRRRGGVAGVLGRFRSPSGVAPSWVFDAANGVYAVSGALVPFQPTFTRAGSATFVGSSGLIQTAATDIPRFQHDPVSLARRGLLVEASRTNLLLRSQGLATSPWNAADARGTVTNNNAVDLFGATEAASWIENTETGARSLVQGVSVTSGDRYVFWAVAKQRSGDRHLGLVFQNSARFGSVVSAIVNMATGAVASGGPAGREAGSIDLGGGRRLLWLAATAVDSGTNGFSVRMSNDPSSAFSSYTGDGTSGLDILATGVEVGSRPTSYIPTEATAVTRAADSALADATGWVAAGQGTIVASGRRLQSSGIAEIVEFGSGPGDRLVLRQLSNGNPGALLAAGGVIQANVENFGSAPAEGDLFAIAVSYSGSRLAACLNGGAVSQATGSYTVPAFTILQIGSAVGNVRFWNGTISRVLYYPTPLSDADIQAITAALAAGG
jgi:hypothetical protein